MNRCSAIAFGIWVFIACSKGAGSEPSGSARWLGDFLSNSAFRPLESSTHVDSARAPDGEFPAISVAPPWPGRHIVRVSLPFAPGVLAHGFGLDASAPGMTPIPCDVRSLTNYPGMPRVVRRAMVTFPFDFASTETVRFGFSLGQKPALAPIKGVASQSSHRVELNGRKILLSPERLVYSPDASTTFTLTFDVQPAARRTPVNIFEEIETGKHFVWVRLLAGPRGWRGIMDLRLDSEGTLAVDVAIQNPGNHDGIAPTPFGWTISGTAWDESAPREFKDGIATAWPSADGQWEASFPRAADERRGEARVADEAKDKPLRYLRQRADESVPWQPNAWRRAAIVIGKAKHTPRNALLEPELKISIDPKYFAAAYDLAPAPDLSAHPKLAALEEMNRGAILASQAAGDDFGNVTSYNAGQPRGGAYGMNRLNHCPPIFEDSWRKDDRRLRSVAALWCQNMSDLSIWWGEGEGFGGTRYNNAAAAGDKTHEGDANFMWRTNNASHFCTKGFDSFYLAYEETGDPAMLAALHAQVAYAAKHIHAGSGEARNIGDAGDFVRLYKLTGRQEFLDEALRLFRELRARLSPGDLFSQSCDPIAANPPFIENDATGYKHPFAKPYIIGYALAGMPALMEFAPDEPKLRDVVRAVADFLAASVDPAGGWRYPHPLSSSVIASQALEHAAQLSRAAEALEARGEPIENLIDAIETVLRARVLAFAKSGQIYSGLGGWEAAAGMLGEGKPTLEELYATPEARDRSRDWAEGAVSLGSAPPEGLVYLNEVLELYLKRRPAERLFGAGAELEAVLKRIPAQDGASDSAAQ